MDPRQEVTNRVIALLERGVEQFRARWVKAAALGLPVNAKSGEPYHGINVLLLCAVAADAGYQSNRWLTFKQARDIGGCVRKGEKGTLCVYFEMKSKSKVDDDHDPDGDPQFFPMCKPFWLFNVAQIDGLPEENTERPVSDDFQCHALAENIITGSGAAIRYGFDKAYYEPCTDDIKSPHKSQYNSAEKYYATTFHELVHWTGAPARLDRAKAQRFGDAAYAMEELVAELGAAFLCARAGLVDAMIEDHASYIDSWLKVLHRDKTALFWASSQANRAYEYLLNTAGIGGAEVRDAA